EEPTPGRRRAIGVVARREDARLPEQANALCARGKRDLLEATPRRCGHAVERRELGIDEGRLLVEDAAIVAITDEHQILEAEECLLAHRGPQRGRELRKELRSTSHRLEGAQREKGGEERAHRAVCGRERQKTRSLCLNASRGRELARLRRLEELVVGHVVR